MLQGNAEARGGAIIEDVDRKSAEADNFGEPADDVRDVFERVSEFRPRRHGRLSEAGQIGRNHMVAIG